MKKLLFLVTFFTATNLFAAGGVLKFGILSNNPNSRDSLQVFVKFLSEKTGRDFELVEMPPAELLRGLAEGSVAFADLTSAVFKDAGRKYKDKIRYVATVAARNEKGKLVPYYKGVFFVLRDSPYNTLFELKDKLFGFVDKTSTSGYVYPRMMLKGLGITPETFFSRVSFVGEHAKIFESLKNGKLDAGVSNYDSFDKAKTVHGNIFRVIGETAEIPSGAFVASSSVEAGLVKKLEAVLLSIKPIDAIVNYPGFFYKGWVKKAGTFYEGVKSSAL